MIPEFLCQGERNQLRAHDIMSLGAQRGRANWNSKANAVPAFDCSEYISLPPGESLPVVRKRLVPLDRRQESQVSSPWPQRGSSSSQAQRRKDRPKHVPIVISQSVIETVLKKEFPRNGETGGGESAVEDFWTAKVDYSCSLTPRLRPRHIPIVIPNFAQPLDIPPASPPPTHDIAPSPQLTTPHARKISFPKMLHPTTSGSRSSTLDSTVIRPSPDQIFTRQSNTNSSGYSANMNASQTSLSQSSQDDQENSDFVPRPPRVGEAANHSAAPSPATGQQSSSNGGTTNLSGLVCNVHRTTGKEPHALVGATTTILGDKLYVFGGRVLSRRRPPLTSDLYELDLVRRHWTKLETTGDTPPPRYFHSVCALGETKLICYGGMSPASSPSTQTQGNTNQQSVNQADSQPEVVVLSDIHIYDAPTKSWTYVATSNTPQGRYAHCAAVVPSSATFTSANAHLSAIHHNPASSNPNQGTIGVDLDGTGGAEMIIVGGQDCANHYIEQISVFNLRSLKWTSTHSLGRSCGAYRSVVAPLTTMPASRIGKGLDLEEDMEGSTGNVERPTSGSSMLIYSNYNFLDVKLELQVRLADGSMIEKPMMGQFNPPGLRFPNGGVLDNHFVVSGTYLTSSKQEYALWALDLKTLSWSRIDAGGSVFSQGSWNRGILWSRRNVFVILGNRKRSLVEDYNRRRINFSNLCMIELEAFGLYDNPRLVWPTSSFPSISAPILPHHFTPKSPGSGGRLLSSAAIELGRMAMSFRELTDMDLIAIGGECISVNSHLLARRWGPYFVQLLRESGSSSTSSHHFQNDNASLKSEACTLRPSGQPLHSGASRNSSITITPGPGINSSAGTYTLPDSSSQPNAISTASLDPPTAKTLPPASRPRALYLPHTVLTLRALVYYFYTSALPPQNHALCTPQILCSLLQIARPYRVDGLLEAIVERLHQVLDGRNAAAVFNAAAMAAGGGRGTGALFGREGENYRFDEEDDEDEEEIPPDAFATNGIIESLNKLGLGVRRADASSRGDGEISESEDDDTRSEVSGSTRSSVEDNDYMSTANGTTTQGGEEIWGGGISCVVGLQKRGLRGLMEGRRMRERGKSGGVVNGVGLGIA